MSRFNDKYKLHKIKGFNICSNRGVYVTSDIATNDIIALRIDFAERRVKVVI